MPFKCTLWSVATRPGLPVMTTRSPGLSVSLVTPWLASRFGFPHSAAKVCVFPCASGALNRRIAWGLRAAVLECLHDAFERHGLFFEVVGRERMMRGDRDERHHDPDGCQCACHVRLLMKGRCPRRLAQVNASGGRAADRHARGSARASAGKGAAGRERSRTDRPGRRCHEHASVFVASAASPRPAPAAPAPRGRWAYAPSAARPARCRPSAVAEA